METSGLDPEITICKIAVLPIKLCPRGKNKDHLCKKNIHTFIIINKLINLRQKSPLQLQLMFN